MKNEIRHLEHSTYRCQYHIVFATKFRRKVVYGQLRAEIGKILRKLCEEKKVVINRSRGMPRSYSYVSKYPTVYKCITIHGIYQE